VSYSESFWMRVRIEALTAIRYRWSVEKLTSMAEAGSETPASGDALAPMIRIRKAS